METAPKQRQWVRLTAGVDEIRFGHDRHIEPGRYHLSSRLELSNPLRGANFGGLLRLPGQAGPHRFVQAAESEPEILPHALAASDGLLLLQGMEAMSKEPS